MIERDTTPATLALALPLLRHIAEETHGTVEELENAGVLANALIEAGRYAEAEQMERDRIARCVAQGNYRLASAASGQLFTLLHRTGRFEEALQTAKEEAGYTRRAGLGPWTQLGDEGRRLQALNALGRYAEVLDAAEQHRGRMRDLPEESAEEEAAYPWNVRETMLDTGHTAALGLEQWETALALTAECVEYTRQRGADEVKIARTRFNDYGPLLELGRYREARALLEACRAVFEREGKIASMGKVYSALASLEDKEGHPAFAARFEQTALRYKYQAGQPETCAVSHNNLADYLERSDGAPDAVLAHQLAAALIRIQTGSGALAINVRNLAGSPLPSTPPSFAEVCAIVEQVEGVRFGELFAQLPQRAPSGEAAIQRVWEMARDEREGMADRQEQAESVLAGLPEAVREAFLSRDTAKVAAAVAQLSPEQQQAVMDALEAGARQMGVDPEQEARRGIEEVLRNFEPLLQGIAAVARGNTQPRAEIEELLPQLEKNGWRIGDAVRRIWAGERDVEALTAGIDPNSAALVRRMVELVEAP